MTKHQFSFVCTPELRAAVEATADRLAVGGMRPSAAAVIKEAVRRGLPLLDPQPAPAPAGTEVTK